jgi:hypothetical protein
MRRSQLTQLICFVKKNILKLNTRIDGETNWSITVAVELLNS